MTSQGLIAQRRFHSAGRSSSLSFFLLCSFLLACATLTASGQTITFTTSPNSPGVPYAIASVDLAFNYYSYDSHAEASDGSEIVYSIVSGPAEMKIFSQSGSLYWTPQTEGIFNVKVRAETKNNPSVSAEQEWTIVVLKSPEHPGCIEQKTWLPVGNGLPGRVTATAAFQGALYALHEVSPDAHSVLSLSKWNGSTWTAITQINVPTSLTTGSNYITHLVEFRGELLLSITSLSHETALEIPGIMRWNGSTWSQLGVYDFAYIEDMIVHNNSLYVIGRREDQMKNWVGVVTKWDGTGWHTINEALGWRASHLVSKDGTLYITGKTINTPPDQLPLLQIVNDEVRPIANGQISGFHGTVADIVSHNGSLVLMTAEQRFYQWNGTETRELPFVYADTTNVDLISYNNKLYLVGAFQWKNSSCHVWELGDNEWIPISGVKGASNDVYWSDRDQFIEYSGDLYLYGNLTGSCETVINNIAIFCPDNNCTQISGVEKNEQDVALSTALQVYPNPVRGKSLIQLNLSESAHVNLQLIDSRGEVVQVIADRDMKKGEEQITFDSEKLSSGAYYLLLDRDGTKEIYPMMIGK